MARVVYLFGAGASFEDGYGLPLTKSIQFPKYNLEAEPLIVKGLAHSIANLGSDIKMLFPSDELNFDNFSTDLINESREFLGLGVGFNLSKGVNGMDYSLDLLANSSRKRWTKMYAFIKKYIEIYFIIKQSINSNACDDAGKKYIYLSAKYSKYYELYSYLFENLFESSFSISFISWNYDFLFEKAAFFLEIDFFSKKQKESYNKAEDVWLEVGYHFFKEISTGYSKFHILHLNGIAGNPFGDKKISSVFKHAMPYEISPKDSINNNTNYCRANYESLGNSIKFAWDYSEDEFEEQLGKPIQTKMENSEVLVCIGYSFPFFNRKTDQYILKEFQESENGGKSKVIYIQDPNAEEIAKDLKSKFDIKEEVKIVPITNVSSFHIPHQL